MSGPDVTGLLNRDAAELTLRAVAGQHADAGMAWQSAAITEAVNVLVAPAAPAIDLEQFRNAVEAEYQIACASHNTGLTHSTVLIAAVKKRQRLLALIDGQAKCQACGTAIKTHTLTGTICDCALQPTMSEGE